MGAARLLGTLSRAAGCSWLWTQPSFEGDGSVLPVTPRPLSKLTDDTCPMLVLSLPTRVRLSPVKPVSDCLSPVKPRASGAAT